MKKITIYTMDSCPYCEMAKKLFTQKGFAYDEKRVPMDDDAEWDRLEKLTGYKTMPQIFIGEQFIGGYNDLAEMNSSGKLDPLVRS